MVTGNNSATETEMERGVEIDNSSEVETEMECGVETGKSSVVDKLCRYE